MGAPSRPGTSAPPHPCGCAVASDPGRQAGVRSFHNPSAPSSRATFALAARCSRNGSTAGAAARTLDEALRRTAALFRLVPLAAAIAQHSRRSPGVRRLAAAGGVNCGLRGNSGTLKFKGVPDPPGNQ